MGIYFDLHEDGVRLPQRTEYWIEYSGKNRPSVTAVTLSLTAMYLSAEDSTTQSMEYGVSREDYFFFSLSLRPK